MTDVDEPERGKSVGSRLLVALLLTLALSLPLFAVYLLISDRQGQSQFARTSIVEGWGGPQVIAGPFLRIPYVEPVETKTIVNGQAITNTTDANHVLLIAPERVAIDTSIHSQLRHRSIYEAAVFDADVRAAGVFPAIDLTQTGVPREHLRPAQAEIVFALASARGLGGTPPNIVVDGRPLALAPANGVGDPVANGFWVRLPQAIWAAHRSASPSRSTCAAATV